MVLFGVFGTHTTEACPINNQKNRKMESGLSSFNALKIVPLLDFDQLAARLREIDNA